MNHGTPMPNATSVLESTSAGAATAPPYTQAQTIAPAREVAAPRVRIASIDVMRGLVMLFMLVDHVREKIYLHLQVTDPMTLDTTTPDLFFTRLVSAHLRAGVRVSHRVCPPGCTANPASGQPRSPRALPHPARAAAGRSRDHSGQFFLGGDVYDVVAAGHLGHRPQHDRSRPDVGVAALAARDGRLRDRLRSQPAVADHVPAGRAGLFALDHPARPRSARGGSAADQGDVSGAALDRRDSAGVCRPARCIRARWRRVAACNSSSDSASDACCCSSCCADSTSTARRCRGCTAKPSSTR